MENIAYNFWKYYDTRYPLNVMVIGKTVCSGENYHVCRNDSRIMALEYIKKGRQTLIINKKIYYPVRNSVILLTKHSNHEYFCKNDESLEKEWIVFDGPLAKHLIQMYIPQTEYCFSDCNLSHYFDEINRIRKNYSDNYEKMTDNLSVVLHRMFIAVKDATCENLYTLPQKIQRYLDANVEKRLTMEELCEVFNYSKNQIIRVFKETYNVTPYRYFIERKIAISKLYLSNTHYPVHKIAQLLAFSDQNYFSSEFRKITSFSPTEYRKMMNPKD